MDRQEAGLSSRTKGALERIAALEQDVASITKSVSQEINRQQQELSQLSEIVNACVGALGEDVVGKAVLDSRIAKLTEQAEANKSRVAAALGENKLVPAQVVGPNSIIVGREFAKDATEPNPPGVIYINFNAVDTKLQPELLSKKVGESITTPPGGKFEVTEIYDPAPAPAPAKFEVVSPPTESSGDEVDKDLLTDLGLSA